jgi:hypothetical protein
MKTYFVLLLLGLSYCIVQPIFAQIPFTVNLFAANDIYLDTVTIGADPTATFGFDPHLGDEEFFPPFPFIPDFRLLSPRYPNREGFGWGKKKDIRQLVADNQRDTFLIYVQPGDGDTFMTIWWPSEIGNEGAGHMRWTLKDAITRGEIVNVNMNQEQSVTVNTQIFRDFFIIREDGARYRTVTMDSLARIVDLKGKSKSVKKKLSASHWKFSFKNTGTTSATTLEVKFSQVVTSIVAVSGMTYTGGVGSKVLKFSGNVSPGNTVAIEGYGDKGKNNKAKGTWSNGEKVDGSVIVMKLLFPMPNWHNVGEELYQQRAFGADGMVAGIKGKINSVYHPKYKDIQKTLFSKGEVHDGEPTCLDKFTNDKPFKKAVKSLPSAKHNNKLLAEQITLKFNITMHDYDKVETPFDLGDLIYNGNIEALVGKTVSEIATFVDTVLSCDSIQHESLSLLTYTDWYNLIKSINTAFSSAFDTASWGSKLVLTADVSLADGPKSFLKRNAGIQPKTRNPQSVIESSLPERFELQQNYPNPFNPTTTIRFTLPVDAAVTIIIYNMLGQQVTKLTDYEEFTEGVNEIEFDASHLASGVYFYRIGIFSLTDNRLLFTNVKKMMLVR